MEPLWGCWWQYLFPYYRLGPCLWLLQGRAGDLKSPDQKFPRPADAAPLGGRSQRSSLVTQRQGLLSCAEFLGYWLCEPFFLKRFICNLTFWVDRDSRNSNRYPGNSLPPQCSSYTASLLSPPEANVSGFWCIHPEILYAYTGLHKKCCAFICSFHLKYVSDILLF